MVMKKILSVLVAFSVFFSMTVATSLSPTLRMNIDRVLDRDVHKITLFLEKIDAISDRYESWSDTAVLVRDLSEYLKQKRIEYTPYELWSHIGQSIPSWFGALTVSDLTTMQNVFHLTGSEDAPIWVIEFIDFQCPYCQRQNRNEVVSQLRDIEFPWKVRTAVAMFPLWGKRHQLAQQAAESAECVYQNSDSETYESYAKALFARWLQPTRSVIRSVAKEVWLDANTIDGCINEWLAVANVASQKNLWIKLGARGTPATAVVDSRTWAYTIVSWAVPVEQFYFVLEGLWKAVK